jgi:hypothetical protein
MPQDEVKSITISKLVYQTLKNAVADALKEVYRPEANQWLQAQIQFNDEIEASMRRYVADLLPVLEPDVQFASDIAALYDIIKNPESFSWAGVFSGALTSVIISMIMARVSVWAEYVKQISLQKFPITIPDAQLIVATEFADERLRHRCGIWLSKLGYDEDAQKVLRNTLRQHPTVEELIAAEKEGMLKYDAIREIAGWSGIEPRDFAIKYWFRSNRVSFSDAIALFRRGLVTVDYLYQIGSKEGWDNDFTRRMIYASMPIYSVDEALTGMWREVISAKTANEHIIWQGYPPEAIPVLQEIRRPRLSPPTLLDAYYHKAITEEGYYRYMMQLGYRLVDAYIMLQSSTRTLDPTTIMELWHRNRGYQNEWRKLMKMLLYLPAESQQSIYGTLEQLSPEDRVQLLSAQTWIDERHNELMHRAGYTDEQIEWIKTLYPYIPSVPDLVRMAVRDTWNEVVVQKYGYDEDFPAAYVYWCLKQGLSPEWALRYWRAHWDLPSPTMGYEMYHRGIITREELEELLRIADYPKFWREKLIEMAYTPITRVDIRRMYQTGIIKTHEELVRRYKDLGYSPENAEALAQFTEKYYSTSERDLTKADVLGAYRDGALKRDETKEMLIEIGYSPDEAEILLRREDLKILKQLRKQEITKAKNMYLKQHKSRLDVMTYLTSKGFLPVEVVNLLDLWDTQKAEQGPHITVDELIKLYWYGAVPKERFETYLSNMIPDAEIRQWYLTYAENAKPIGRRTRSEGH